MASLLAVVIRLVSTVARGASTTKLTCGGWFVYASATTSLIA
jgi:hypothetical protein